MENHSPQLELIRSELRKIRDAAEVIAMTLIWIGGVIVIFSGWVWSRPVGWQAALALFAIVGFSIMIGKGIRDAR